MKTALDKVRARVMALDDHTLITKLLESEDLDRGERNAFLDMRAFLFTSFGEPDTTQHLSSKQRKWAREVLIRVTPIPAADVPRGREVPTPEVLKRLPTKPPPRKRDDDGQK